MDFINKVTGNDSANQQQAPSKKGDSSTGNFNIMDKVNSMAGGGAKSEKHEDGLDKAVDFVQEKFLGQGDQSNETAVEQAKDEQISDFVRAKYKATTGSDFPIADKDKKYGS